MQRQLNKNKQGNDQVVFLLETKVSNTRWRDWETAGVAGSCLVCPPPPQNTQLDSQVTLLRDRVDQLSACLENTMGFKYEPTQAVEPAATVTAPEDSASGLRQRK